jgi:DNA-directed RNA polymerase specialized sigma24 family protein
VEAALSGGDTVRRLDTAVLDAEMELRTSQTPLARDEIQESRRQEARISEGSDANTRPAAAPSRHPVLAVAAGGDGQRILNLHETMHGAAAALDAEHTNSGNGPLTVDLQPESEKRLASLLRAHGRGSELALEFEVAFKDAGVGALHSLHKNKLLFRRLDSLGVLVPRTPPVGFRESFRSLVYLAVYTAVPTFIDEYLFGEKWDPAKVSLRTAMVNACLCQFGNEYRRFCTQEDHNRKIRVDLTKTGEYDELEPDATGAYAPRSPLGPEGRALRTAALERVLSIRSISSEDKMILIREAQGYSHQEIAAEFTLKPSTVESRLRRAKKKIAEAKLQGGGAAKD